MRSLAGGRKVLNGICINHYADGVRADKLCWSLDRLYSKTGASLQGLRNREGLTQVEFARRIGVERGHVSRMERGVVAISSKIDARIKKAFG